MTAARSEITAWSAANSNRPASNRGLPGFFRLYEHLVAMNDDDVVYFNNCKGRDHVGIFGHGAFFDLDVTGSQSKQALDLPVGQECVVASYTDSGRIAFDWYALAREATLPDDIGNPCRVFFGDLLSTEMLPKPKAAGSKRYSAFFNVNGHFKRPSVIHGDVADRHRPRSKQKKVTFCAEEVDPADGPFIEGATCRITVNSYERNAAARTACLEHYGSTCWICDFDFGIEYGPEANGYIHVHHLKPLSQMESSYKVDPERDLRPVCPNCHAVIHLGGGTRSLEDIKTMRNSLRSQDRRTG